MRVIKGRRKKGGGRSLHCLANWVGREPRGTPSREKDGKVLIKKEKKKKV